MTAGDFNGDGKSDLAFNTDDGLLDVMLATSGGSLSSATSLTLPSGHLAIGVTTVDYNNDGTPDLVVESANTNVEEFGSLPFVSLDLFAGSGSGSFSHISSYLTVGQPDLATVGLVAGDFRGSGGGLQVAVPISDGGDNGNYLDIVPLSTSGTWSDGVVYATGGYNPSAQPGNIVAADLNGAGKPSIALTNGDTGEIWILLADPDSNQFLPLEQVSVVASGTSIGMLAVAPFDAQAATAGYRGPSPSTPRPWCRTPAGPGPEPILTAPSSSSTPPARRPPRPTATATRRRTRT